MYVGCMSQTTIRVDSTRRDALARVAAERPGDTMDQALARLVWEHDCRASLARLETDPQALADYETEQHHLGDAATEVIE